MLNNESILTIDGPSGSGKGTVAQLLAAKLGWHYLDSGALYRVLGLVAKRRNIDFSDEQALCAVAKSLELKFEDGKTFLEGESIDGEIRTEVAGNLASKIAVLNSVRLALLDWQRGCAQSPGLVADGRDMGTVVFPGAKYKIYLTASVEARAQRRFKQLRDKGFSVNIRRLLHEIAQRDKRDSERETSPLKQADDAIYLDTTALTVTEVVNKIIDVMGQIDGK